MDKIGVNDKMLRLLAETCADGIYFFDVAGKFVYVNDSYCRIFGYKLDELLEKHYSIILPESHQSQGTENFKSLINGDSLQGGFLCKRKNGEKFPVYFSAAPVFEGSDVVGFTGTMRDISQEKNKDMSILKLSSEIERLKKELNFFKNSV
jgi:PAS domain S-box-containing protein